MGKPMIVTFKKLGLSLLALAFITQVAFAQDPFGAAPAGGGNPFGAGGGGDPFGTGAPPADNPFGAGGTPKGPAPTATDAGPAVSLSSDPLIAAVAESKPTTPPQLMRAITALTRYGAHEEAKRYLRQLQASEPSEEVLLQLHKEFTSSPFFTLLRSKEMQPEGAEFANRVLGAATAAAQDADHLAALVKKLNDPSILTRSKALAGLKNAGRKSLAPMLAALADSSRAPEHHYIALAIVEMGVLMEEPMIGVLESRNEQLRTHAAFILGRMKSRGAIQYLVGPYIVPSYPKELRRAAGNALLEIMNVTPTKPAAVAYLHRRAVSYFEGETPSAPRADGTIIIWRWDQDLQLSVPVAYPAQDASLVVASKLARDLNELAPEEPEYRRLFLAAALEVEKRSTGLGQPLSLGQGGVYQTASSQGVEAIEDVLDYALKQNRTGAAIGAIQVLGEIGDEQLLASTGGQPRRLAQALRYGDDRVRFAAANAIMRFQPRREFPGSSQIPEVLTRAVRTQGIRRALIGYPSIRDAQTLSAYLQQIGFDSDFATTGEPLLLKAVTEPDYQVILLSDAISRPNIRSLVQQLRRDPRTAGIPIGIMGQVINLPRLRLMAEEDPLLEAFPRPFDVDSMASQTYRLLSLAERNLIEPGERIEQGRQALSHLNHILETPERYPFFPLIPQEKNLISALAGQYFREEAAEALGLLGTPAAQLALVNVASENVAHVEERLAAAKALHTAVQRRGLLLTNPQITVQYDRYNQSEALSAETQSLLAYVLDIIEQPAQATPPNFTPAAPPAAPEATPPADPAATPPGAVAPPADTPAAAAPMDPPQAPPAAGDE